MTFVRVTNDTVTEERGTPPTEGELPDGRTVSGITPTNFDMLAACGWHPVTDTPRPDDTDTTTHERSLANESGTWTVVWTPRPWTADELAARTAPTPDDRIAALEAQNAELLAALAKVTTVAQVRAAAQAAAG